MALTLKVNGTDRSTYVKWNTLMVTEVLSKEVDRMEFEITKTPSKSSLPDVNDLITLDDDSGTIFGGVIVERNEVIRGGILIGYQYKCKDYSQFLDRKLVVKSYVGQTARAIFLDILSTYTSGFTTTNIPASTPTVPTVKFNYEQVTRCFTQVCDLIGWDWYVDFNKDIHLFSTETAPAPFSLTDTSDNFEWATLEINKTILQLKNSIYVRGGDYKKTFDATNTPDVYKGDGTKLTFPLAYQYATIAVTKNGVLLNVGTDQQTDPATVDCVYNFNEKIVKFNTGSAPISTDTIKMYGDALIPIIGLVRDHTSIAAYGEYQAIIVDKQITSISEAQTRAQAEAVKYSESVYEGQFKTLRTGLRTGMKINITSAIRNISKDFKINRIVGKTRNGTSMEYMVYIIASGQVNFTDIMVALLQQNVQNVDVADNEVLQDLEYFPESFTLADTLNAPTFTAGPYKWGADAAQGNWNFSTWG